MADFVEYLAGSTSYKYEYEKADLDQSVLMVSLQTHDSYLIETNGGQITINDWLLDRSSQELVKGSTQVRIVDNFVEQLVNGRVTVRTPFASYLSETTNLMFAALVYLQQL